MSVIVLMYHRTPSEAGHILDVPMPLFRSQMQTLKDAGVRFIRFGSALQPQWYDDETVVAVTFDDGHGSNLEAMAFLRDAGIPCTSFFVTQFLLHPHDGFMDLNAFKTASTLCEVGGHGATHTSLTSLAPAALKEELSRSKVFLEDLCGRPVTTLSAPGGHITQRVVHTACELGFKVVADSYFLINNAPRLPLHRLCMFNGQSPERLLSLVRAKPIYWQYKRLKWMAGLIASRVLTPKRFEALTRTFKGGGPGPNALKRDR